MIRMILTLYKPFQHWSEGGSVEYEINEGDALIIGMEIDNSS